MGAALSETRKASTAGFVTGLPEASLAALRCAAILSHSPVCVFQSLPLLHSQGVLWDSSLICQCVLQALEADLVLSK